MKKTTNKKRILNSISYSAYRDYLKCPVLFMYRRVLKLKLPFEPLPLVLGKAFHAALEQMERDKADPVKVFNDLFQHSLVPHITKEKFNEEKIEALRLIKYWQSHKDEILKEEKITMMEQEVPFALTVTKNPVTGKELNIPVIKGFVDFTHKAFNLGKNGIGDYKTSSKKYHQKDVDESDQPTFYYLWHLLERGKLPEEFVYIVYRKGIKGNPIQVLRTHRTLEQVSALLIDIQRVCNKIEAREFSRRHNESERYCDCTLYDEMLKV